MPLGYGDEDEYALGTWAAFTFLLAGFGFSLTGFGSAGAFVALGFLEAGEGLERALAFVLPVVVTDKDGDCAAGGVSGGGFVISFRVALKAL